MITLVWSKTYDMRMLFEFVQNAETGEKEILLLTVGGHNDVY